MNKQQFADLVIQNEQQLYRIAKSILYNDEDCADAAQEALAKGFANLHTLKQDRYAKTWLIRILIHECYRILKENGRTLPLEEKTLRASEEESLLNYSALYEALYQLPENIRLVLVMHYLEGYAVSEIADILQIASGTVKSRLSRGRLQLKSLLKNDKEVFI